MFDFEFEYNDGSILTAENVNQATYYIGGMEKTVAGEEISTYKFPLSADLHLLSDDTNYSISHQGLLKIRITKHSR